MSNLKATKASGVGFDDPPLRQGAFRPITSRSDGTLKSEFRLVWGSRRSAARFDLNSLIVLFHQCENLLLLESYVVVEFPTDGHSDHTYATRLLRASERSGLHASRPRTNYLLLYIVKSAEDLWCDGCF
jgi:hypothetical protein